MSSSGVLGTLVIRIAAEMRKYREDLNTVAKDTEESAKKIEAATTKASVSTNKLMGDLERQVKTYGMSASELRRYDAAQTAMLPKQREVVNAHLETLDALERQTERQKEISKSATAMGVAIAAAAVGAATGVGLMVKSAIDNADAVSKLSAKTGIATETLSAYQHAASMSNVSNETLATGMKALSKNVADGAEVLGRMGISTKDSQGNLRSLDDVMGDVAEKFKGYKDGAGKAALAQEVFGRSGMDMITMLNDGRAGLDSMKAEAVALGLVIDGQTGKAAEAFNDNLTRLHARSQGYAASLAAQLLPAMTAVTESFIEGGKNSGFMRGAVDVLAGALKGLISIGYGVGAVFEQIGTYFGGIAAAAAAMIRGDFSQVKTIFGDLSKDLSDKAAASGARINQVWSAIGDGAKKAGAEMDQVDAPGKLAKVGKAAKETGDAFAAEREAAKVWERAMLDAAAASSAAAAQTDGLSATERKLRDYLESTAYTINQQTNPAMNEMAVKKWEAAIADEKLAKATLAANKAQEQQVESLTKGLAKIEEEIAQQKLHNAEIGLGKDAVADLTAARLEDQAAMLEGQAIKQMDKNLDLVQYELLMSQARALRELAALKREGGAAQVAVDAAKEATRAWDKFADQVNQSLSDALMNGFTAGKGFAKSFVDSVKAMFNTMVLRPVISAIVSPVAGALTGALGFSGAAQAAGTGSSLLSGGSSLLGAGSALAGVGSFMGELGTGLLASTQTALGLTATAAQASYAASMGVAAQTGSLIGSLGPLITAAPYLAALAGVYMLAKNLDHSGTPHTGGGSSYSASAGLSSTPTGRWTGGTTWGDGFGSVMGSADANEMTAKLTQSIVGILDSTATTFGQQAGYAAATSFADDSSKDGAWGSLLLKLGDTVLTDWNAARTSKWAPRVFSDGSAGSAEYLAAVSQDVRAALDGIDLPEWARKTVDALGDAPSLEQMAAAVQQITAIQNAIAGQRAGLQQQLDLLTGVTTQREIERNALDESNRALYDQITALQDQQAATEAAAEAARAVASERAGLQQELDLLTGVTTQREIERNALDESNRALYDQIMALKDQQAAADAAADAADAAADAARAEADARAQAAAQAEAAAQEAARLVAQERTGLENALLQALGETATLRQRELDALNPANRALQEQVYAVNDAKEAIASLTSDIARLDQIARQAAGLSNRIGVMLGGTDNTEAGLWATVNNASATAEDRLGAIGELVEVINNRITTDTQEAQRVLTEGAQQAQQAIEAANAAQQAGANAQLEAAQKMADLGQQLRDYVQGLRLGSSSALTPGQRLALAARDYQTSLSGARAGDQQAMAALQGHAGTYLELARQYDAGSYAQVFADVTGALDSFGGSLMSEGQQQAATAQATLASIQSVSASSAATTEAVLAGNVISDANRQALEMLLGLSTQIQADAAIEKAAKQAQVTAETNRMEAIRTSLSDAGVIALGVTSTAQVMTDFASQQKVDNAALLKQVAELTQRIADLEMNTVNALGGVAGVVQQAGSDNAKVVAQAVATAVSEAADKVVIA